MKTAAVSELKTSLTEYPFLHDLYPGVAAVCAVMPLFFVTEF